MDKLLDWAFANGGIAVWAVVNTGILVYVLKGIDNKLDKLNMNFEQLLLKKRR